MSTYAKAAAAPVLKDRGRRRFRLILSAKSNVSYGSGRCGGAP
ncbi:hypothetical protein FRUB_00811 [Fimbriiglobus ruber]|uniref:Uncharacterized protein n=1 Tax=Fimbriiglobus ruber TaxID=1908690 RepID=A0A225E0M4_9BACT|nr:hypothetical protein FRUB_00811 [Fimbriiglobus ruber]